MKVKELIKRLRKFPPDAIALVRGYDTGYDVVADVRAEIVAPSPVKGECVGVFDLADDSFPNAQTAAYIEPYDALDKHERYGGHTK